MAIITKHVCFAMLPVDMKEAVVKAREVMEGNTGSARGLQTNSTIEQLVLDAFSFPGTDYRSTSIDFEIVPIIS